MGASDIPVQPSVQLAAQPARQGHQQHHLELHQQQLQQQQQHGRYPQLQMPGHAQLASPTAVLAPGGFSVLSPGAPPPQLPTPFIDCQRPTSCSSSSSSSSSSSNSSKSSSCCKPVTAQYDQQYNPTYGQHYKQQQYMGMPAYPVSICVGQPVSPPMAQQEQQHQQQADKEGDCCQCTLGWALYGLGWIFPLCWVAAIILPFLTKTQGDKRAAIASGVTLGVLVVLAVLITVVIISVAAATPTNW